MLAHRVIPTLLCSHGNLVKGKQFNSSRVVGNVRQAAEIHQMRHVDELIVLDVSATPEGRGPDFEAMAKLTDGCFMPIAVGGGVTSVEDVRELLRNGADKVVIGTAAVKDPMLIYTCAEKFGSQAIVVAIDVFGLGDEWAIVSECGKKRCYEMQLDEYVELLGRMGAGEVIVTNIARDGTMTGYDIPLIGKITSMLDIPVIASGGASGYEDFEKALHSGASAVAAGALFQWTDCTPRDASAYLAAKGWEMRL